MEPVFRSRGIRIFPSEEKLRLQEKIYYEPDERCRMQNKCITDWSSRGLISLFEYSTTDGGIDTYNFHVNLANKHCTQIYAGLDKDIAADFDAVRECFGPTFLNYTVGYRLDGARIINQSYYFYPTIWRETRYGIKGVTDRKRIVRDVTEYSNRITKENRQSQNEIYDFASILCKFKGVSIHVSEHVTGYKLYGRAGEEELRSHILDRSGYDILENTQHGETVLAAVRISGGLVKGYNVYYLS